MLCPNCQTEAVEKDIYCRHCGVDLTETSTSIVPAQRSLPALLSHSPVQRGVAAGVGALALGVGIELVRRNILARMLPSRSTRRALSTGPDPKDVLFSRSDKAVKLPRGYEMQEVVVYMSRVIRRQH